MYDKVIATGNNVDTRWFVLKTKHDTEKLDLENNINDADKKFLILVDLLIKQIITQRLLK